jgi:hypothetical protein
MSVGRIEITAVSLAVFMLHGDRHDESAASESILEAVSKSCKLERESIRPVEVRVAVSHNEKQEANAN